MSEPSKEHIGYCEWCGLLDHHLIEGECAACRAKLGAAVVTDDDVALGDESDVRHVFTGAI